MANPVNEWIRDGGDQKGKNKRRMIVAGICAVVAIVAAPFTNGLSLGLLAVSAAKVYVMMKDKK